MSTSDTWLHIACYMAASAAVLAAIIWGVSRLRDWGHVPLGHALMVAGLISVAGILIGKYGANYGLPWYVYYTVPMLATLFIPPIVYNFGLLRSLIYIVLAFLSAPTIHFLFVKLVGWTDYMPFLKIAH